MKLASFFVATAMADTFQFNIGGTVWEGQYEAVKRNFWETKAHCDSLGGGWQMPTPTNSNDNEAAFKVAKGRGNIYIGIAQYQNQNATLSSSWFNVYTQTQSNYSSWMSGQPNNWQGNEDFAVMLK